MVSMSRSALSRRRVLGLLAVAGGVSLAGRVRAQNAKASQAEALYQSTPKGQQRCDICLNFQAPDQCTFVEGPISPKGWCQFFAARENAH
jgi:hypothetical protein